MSEEYRKDPPDRSDPLREIIRLLESATITLEARAQRLELLATVNVHEKNHTMLSIREARRECTECLKQLRKLDAGAGGVGARVAGLIAQMREIRHEAHRVVANNGWGDKRAVVLGLTIRDLADAALLRAGATK